MTNNIEELIRKDVILKPYTTFKCGGPAKYFAEPSSEDEIRQLVLWAAENGIRYEILGLASNVLVSDEGFDGLIIRLGKEFSEVTFEDRGDTMTVTAQAGCPLAVFGKRCADNSLTGAEFACGIPGSVGGAVFMNAGAYGGEVKDFIRSVTYLKDGEIKKIKGEDCRFGYRKSIFAEDGNCVILSMSGELSKGNKEEIDALIAELKAKRIASQPVDVPSAGSTFKRPEGYFAGKLVQDSGLKGFALDDSGARVSPKHSGFVVNEGGKASAEDVKRLIEYVRDKVYADSGVRLEPEVRLIGGDCGWNS